MKMVEYFFLYLKDSGFWKKIEMSELDLRMNCRIIVLHALFQQVLSFIAILTSRFKDNIVNRLI